MIKVNDLVGVIGNKMATFVVKKITGINIVVQDTDGVDYSVHIEDIIKK